MKPGAHRETARVVLHNSHQELFLLLTHFDPEVQLPPRWLVPGGGIDAGETAAQAAVRELYEETGLEIQLEPDHEPIHSITGTWIWGDGINQHSYTDHFYLLQIDDFELDTSNWTADEHRDVLEHGWYAVDELMQRSEYELSPPGLVEFLREHKVIK